jgi:hypothetical protein
MKNKKAPVIIELSPEQLGQATGGVTTIPGDVLTRRPISTLPVPGIRFHRCPSPTTLDVSPILR